MKKIMILSLFILFLFPSSSFASTVKVNRGEGLSHVALKAGMSDWHSSSSWSRIAQANGYSSWQTFNRSLRAGQSVSTTGAPKSAVVKPVAVSKSSSGVGCSSYRYLVAQYSGWDVDTMMYAMFKESSCNPNAVGDQYTINGVYAPSCGLLQVRTLPGRPSCEALKDPAYNIQVAYGIWQSQGYRAWSTLH